MLLSSEKGSIPLYMQIKEMLVAKVSAGKWAPGSIIPSEIRLAQELNVSQGTVRKAISELVEANVVVRRQGKGTFVTNHDENRALFHFFHIYNNRGIKFMPECETLSCKKKRASRSDAARLEIPDRSEVVRIERIRKLEGTPTIAETITLPAAQFEELDQIPTDELPNMLYELYETRFGITIHSAEEQLRATPSSKRDAKLLGIEPGSPLLEIVRTAMTLDATPVEIRTSRCNTSRHCYRNTVF